MRSRRTVRRALLASLFACGAFALQSSAIAAGVPKTITHQGRLYDAADKPINATLVVQFAIYVDSDATTPIWTETSMVTFEDGYFSVSIGENTPFTNSVFDGSVRYLGITVGSDPEMTPRVPVQSVPYAMVAGDAIGDIHPTTVVVNGTTVIDGTGKWVGNTAGLQGPQGPQGPQGLQGAVGPTGPTGVAGATGATGPAGATGAAGAQGAQGVAGPQGNPGTNGINGTNGATGPAGANGSNGATGATGPAGANGSNGTNGSNGATGATGPAGPTGAQGIVSASYASGYPGDPTPTLAFLTTPVSVTVSGTTQKVHVVASRALGSAVSGGGTNLNLYTCWQQGAGAINALDGVGGGGMWGLTAPQNQRHIFTVTGVLTGLAAGTYNVGMCGQTSTTPNVTWDNNEYGYTSAFVAN